MSTVCIRPVTVSDREGLHAAALRSRSLHEPWYAAPQTVEAWQAFIERRSGPHDLGFVVSRVSDAALVGFIDITNIVRGVFQSGYLSYFAVAGHERRGYMGAGLKQLVNHAFTQLGLHRLEANIRPENEASIALVRRVGFTREGYSSRYLKLGGEWRDHERWAILNDE